MSEEIEILSVDPQDSWPVAKKKQWEHLQLLTTRIAHKADDITSNLGDDYFYITNIYAMFGALAQKDFHVVCSLAKDYNFDQCEDDFKKAIEKTKFKTLRKLIQICRFYGIDTDFQDESADDEAALYFLPESVDRGFVLQHGFYSLIDGQKTGYYFRSGEKTFTAQSNFVIEPLMHVYAKNENNKRIIMIHNGTDTVMLDMPSKNLISIDKLNEMVYNEGNFYFWGSKMQLVKLLMAINEKFPMCRELTTLGWQPAARFFAWNDKAFYPKDNRLIDFDEKGIVDINGKNFFSPSISEIYINTEGDDDEYINDRFLTYNESPITFEQWMVKMVNVYRAEGMIGIAFVLAALFRDIIYKVDNNFPLLSCYGQKGSGKSKFAESLAAVFLHNMQPFNLNHGTDYAFFNRLGRFFNCIVWFEEFDDNAIKEERFQSIKGVYDGVGRERGKGGNKNKTEIIPINSAVVLTGQYLSTRDDNSALTRCIILPFRPEDDRPPAQQKAYTELKETEKKGISSILVEALQYRHEVEKEYTRLFPVAFAELKEAIHQANGVYKERVVRNYAALLTAVKYFMQKFKFPFTWADFFERCKQDAITLGSLINDSDALADFWNTVTYLLDMQDIIDGFHFKIKEETTVTVGSHGDKREIKFPQPVKILYLRLTTVHKLYMEAFRRQNGKTGINMQSLVLYISSSPAFLGVNSSQRFTDQDGKTTITSSYVFNYETLNVPLERFTPDEDPEKEITEITGEKAGEVKIIEFGGKPQVKFQIRVNSSYKKDGFPVQNLQIFHCYCPDLQKKNMLYIGEKFTVSGLLRLEKYKDQSGREQLKRTMDVISIEQYTAGGEEEPTAEDLPF